MLPDALAIGVPYETFWHLTPKRLKAFYEAYKTKRETQDEQMWYMGQYVLSAVFVAVEHALHGNKAKSEYIKKPLMQAAEEPMSEENLQKQRELFVATLEAMKTNFELNHGKE